MPTVITGTVIVVRDAAISPDGKRIVIASLDGTAGVWDAQNGSLLVTLSGHNQAVYSATFSPNGKRIVTRRLILA